VTYLDSILESGFSCPSLAVLINIFILRQTGIGTEKTEGRNVKTIGKTIQVGEYVFVTMLQIEEVFVSLNEY
jgi:hypothetical protein